MADLDKNKGVWLDWDGVNWLVNTGRQSLNSKCHYEYQEMLVCVATLFTYLDPPLVFYLLQQPMTHTYYFLPYYSPIVTFHDLFFDMSGCFSSNSRFACNCGTYFARFSLDVQR